MQRIALKKEYAHLRAWTNFTIFVIIKSNNNDVSEETLVSKKY